MSLEVININEGDKIQWDIQENTITLGDLTIDLSAREKDIPITIDISRDSEGNLIEGIGDFYIANIIIPPRRYGKTVQIITDAEGNEINQTIPKALPFDINRVKLQLWAMGGNQ